MRKILAALALWLATCTGAAAQTCAAYSFTFTPNTTIQSSQVNSNFATIRNCANTNLAPLATPTFTGPVAITGTPLGISSGGTGASSAAAALSNLGAVGLAGPNNFTGANNEAFGTIASAATTNIGAATANYLQVTGTTTITAFDTIQAGTERTLEFAGALTLTNSGNIILPNGVNIVTIAGDVFKFRSEGGGVWRYVASNRSKQPTRTVLTSGSGTYTTPTGAVRLNVRMVGGGGGGQGGGATATAGGNSTFGALTASGGGTRGGSPGTGTGGDVNITGGTAATFSGAAGLNAGPGGGTPFGSGGGGGVAGAGAGQNASANTGAGGGGGGGGTGVNEGSGHGGGYLEKLITSPSATYAYAVGAGGTGSTGSGSQGAGGNGGSGIIIVDEYYY